MAESIKGPWRKLYLCAYEDAKIMELAERLGIDHMTAAGAVMGLWCHAGSQGVLHARELRHIEELIRWRGARGVLVAAFIESGLLDGSLDGAELHNRFSYGGSHILAVAQAEKRARTKADEAKDASARAKATERKRRSRAHKKTLSRSHTGTRQDGNSVTARDTGPRNASDRPADAPEVILSRTGTVGAVTGRDTVTCPGHQIVTMGQNHPSVAIGVGLSRTGTVNSMSRFSDETPEMTTVSRFLDDAQNASNRLADASEAIVSRTGTVPNASTLIAPLAATQAPAVLVLVSESASAKKTKTKTKTDPGSETPPAWELFDQLVTSHGWSVGSEEGVRFELLEPTEQEVRAGVRGTAAELNNKRGKKKIPRPALYALGIVERNRETDAKTRNDPTHPRNSDKRKARPAAADPRATTPLREDAGHAVRRVIEDEKTKMPWDEGAKEAGKIVSALSGTMTQDSA